MPRSPKIGAHVSIAGALTNAVDEAVELGCNCFQIFTRSPRMWRAPTLSPADCERFRAARAQQALSPLVVHGSYLINLASPERDIRERSILGFRSEIERALEIGADYLVIHPGSAKGYDSAAPAASAIETLARAAAQAARGIEWNGLELLLENTAGGGASLGRDFTELAAVRDTLGAESDIPVAFCLDTCHAFAAGFDISQTAGLRDTIKTIDRAIGIDAVRVIHANDSKADLGSRIDRHEHIGEGKIGAEAFRRILRHPKLRRKPFILETPQGPDGTHRKNVEALQALAR